MQSMGGQKKENKKTPNLSYNILDGLTLILRNLIP